MRRAYLVATCQSCHGQFGRNGSEPPNQDGAGMRVLILGGGVIGTSITYHLTARGADVVVLERSAVACAASGKSGGFLAVLCSNEHHRPVATSVANSRHYGQERACLASGVPPRTKEDG